MRGVSPNAMYHVHECSNTLMLESLVDGKRACQVSKGAHEKGLQTQYLVGCLPYSPQGSDFPAALLRFGAGLGIEIEVCEPHHPQQNAFVERYHRSYQEECLALEQ